MSEKKPDIIIVADFYARDIAGGAELTTQALIDSALVLDRIAIGFIDGGPGSHINIDVARINHVVVDSSLTFTDSSSLNFNKLRPFYILDSQGITTLYDNSVTYFAAYQLIDSS